MNDIEEIKRLLGLVLEGMDSAYDVSQPCYVGTYWRRYGQRDLMKALSVLEIMAEGEAALMIRQLVDANDRQFATIKHLIELVCERCMCVPWSLGQMGKCDECTKLEPPTEHVCSPSCAHDEEPMPGEKGEQYFNRTGLRLWDYITRKEEEG